MPPPSSTPTETAVASHPGQSVLPVSCVDLLDAGLVREIAGEGTVLRADEDRLVREAPNVALRQAGGLQCVWDEADALVNRNESGGLNIWVFPSSREDYEAALATLGVPAVDVVTPAGTTADLESCQVDDGNNGLCRAHAFQDGYRVWIHVKAAEVAASDLEARTLRVVDAVVDTIRSAHSPRVIPPVAAQPASEACTSAALASVVLELGITGQPDARAATSAFTSDGMTLHAPPADIAECTWGSSAFARIVTGAGWAMPGLLAGADGYLPLEQSADGVFLSGCPDGCTAVFLSDGDVVFLSIEPPADGSGIETHVAAALAG
jgi:hypothetical protein